MSKKSLKSKNILLDLNLQKHGIEIKQNLLSPDLIQAVISEVEASDQSMPKHGIRNAEKKFPSILKAVYNKQLLAETRNLLGKEPQLVRVLFFDKTPEKNWLVTWHQDKTVALSDRVDIDGWGPWSLKDGTHHVQPPLDVLNEMLAFRLHLDPANEQNGCLKVIPGSHKYGILKQGKINEIANRDLSIACIVEVGDAVVMRPHILHSSSKATQPDHRRVIHIEFSNYELPQGIHWA